MTRDFCPSCSDNGFRPRFACTTCGDTGWVDVEPRPLEDTPFARMMREQARIAREQRAARVSMKEMAA